MTIHYSGLTEKRNFHTIKIEEERYEDNKRY